MKLFLDPGHGGNDSGAAGNGLLEKNINLDIAIRIRNILLNEYQNVEVRMSRTSDISVTLNQRTSQANEWNADYFLSIHCNSFNGQAAGYEDYIYQGLADSSQTAAYRNIMHNHVTSVNSLTDRGRKKANFHVLRESAMPAILTENGFIDNANDASLMAGGEWRQAVARGHVNGLEEAFNLQHQQNAGSVYRVIAGSFENRENADNRRSLFQSNGIGAVVVETTVSNQTRYRVQTGAFKYRDNAERRLEEVRRLGIEDAFILTDEENTSVEGDNGISILGDVVLSPHLLDQYVRSIHDQAPQIGAYYLKYGNYYGIRGDIAFAQALHETDYFRFTGVVQPEQNNYGGLGATGPDNPGESFETPEDGVMAHLQHLYAYASTSELPSAYPLLDSRFELVERGSAPSWIGLNGKWAVPGNEYGQLILNMYERLIKFSQNTLEDILENIKT
ncbi:N-acetylmuramoyl-L-alanine amidase [Salibacterium aidingense]|uniref:N-acetylmuramoyl-L-alanine amidase n=1 Tax=Salibacterium aidingense TaxID=384933 RepID=UPI0003FB1F22|nr:N-acetylmuramoyl-L-alanine amidase [Salibacterium aidingense]